VSWTDGSDDRGANALKAYLLQQIQLLAHRDRDGQSVGQARLSSSVAEPAVPRGRPMASASVNEVEPFMPDIEAQVTGLSAMTSGCLKEFACEVVRGNSAT
jgi:hypothetical protein